MSAKLPEKSAKLPLRSRKEAKICSNRLRIDKVYTEYPIGDYNIDAIIHRNDCTWYVVEVEERLNDIAIGQVIKYRALLYGYRKIVAKPLIICKEANPELI